MGPKRNRTILITASNSTDFTLGEEDLLKKINYQTYDTVKELLVDKFSKEIHYTITPKYNQTESTFDIVVTGKIESTLITEKKIIISTQGRRYYVERDIYTPTDKMRIISLEPEKEIGM